MTAPSIDKHAPTAAYLRSLLAAAGLTQEGAAEAIGVSPRTMRNYLSDKRRGKVPYAVQFTLERLAAAGDDNG